jgi:hypothetical protein
MARKYSISYLVAVRFIEPSRINATATKMGTVVSEIASPFAIDRKNS